MNENEITNNENTESKKITIPPQVYIYLGLAIFFQLIAICFMFVRAEQIKSYAEKNGTIIRVHCTAFDPFNPLKGRYVRLSITHDDELNQKMKELNLTEKKLRKASSEYYMQENYADAVDQMKWKDFNALNPVLEIYVDKKGNCIQKALYVTPSDSDGNPLQEIPIEKYIKEELLQK